MEIEYLDDATAVGEAFIDHFVLSWESFQIKHKDWIAKMNESDYPIDKKWYDRSYLWDRMDPAYPGASMKEALDFLRDHPGPVMFLTEKGEDQYFRGKKTIAFIARTDARLLADQIEYEWYEFYRSAEQNVYFAGTLPDDLYVFDSSMKWCVVFTHETTDWEAEESDDMMKAAQSRYCILYRE